MSKKTEFKHGVQYTIVQLVATPGLVVLLLNWLLIILVTVYALAVETSTVQPYVAASQQEQTTGPVTMGQLLFATILSLFLWYAMGFGVHWGLSKLANKFEDPLKTYRILTIGGTVLSALILVVGSFLLVGESYSPFGLLLGSLCGVIGLISFGLQQLLAKLWNVELV